MIEHPGGVLAVLAGVCALYFHLERRGFRVFETFPPLLWIYATPVLLSNGGIIPTKSFAYDILGQGVLPCFLVLLLIGVDLRAALKTMGRGVVLMLIGSFGIVLGAVVACALASPWMGPNAYQQFGVLSGAFIGGTGNMAAVAAGLELQPGDYGLAILADNAVYIVWLPLLLGSKRFAERFNRWAGVAEADRGLGKPDAEAETPRQPSVTDFMYLIAATAGIVFVSDALATLLPEFPPVLSSSTWKTLLLTTFSIAASFTPLRQLPGSRALGTALVYLFLAGMGARATLSGFGDAPVFLAACFLWLAIHGITLLVGARILRVGLQTAAISSAANIGGVASAPVVAAHHDEGLVPASILMAMVGYAAGNYLATLTTQLCYWVSG